jgi:hypothetical protein
MILSAPVLMIAGGIVFLLAAVKVFIQQKRALELVPYSDMSLDLPRKWDDAEITKLLQRHHDQPTVLAHAVSSIKSRMILNQDVKTAQQRLKLVASVIEVFKLNREMQGVLHDLHLAEKEFAIRQIETDIRLEDVQAHQKSEQRLRQLRQQHDEMQLQRELVQLKQDADAISNPPKVAPQLSPQEQRANDKKSCEAKIADLKTQKAEALKIDEEEERIRKVNAIDNALEREYERWSKLL